MSDVAPLPPQMRSIDADRVGELIGLLGAEQFRQLFTQLQDALAALETATRSGADAPQLAAMLHRLQGSASALGLVETAATIVQIAEKFAADRQLLSLGHCRDLLASRLVQANEALTLAETALADRFPGLPRRHG